MYNSTEKNFFGAIRFPAQQEDRRLPSAATENLLVTHRVEGRFFRERIP